MPSSYHGFIVDVLNIYIQEYPKKVLDVGIGFGKWGYLFRDYGDIFRGKIYPNQWQIQIDGIEAFEQYVHEAHKYIYNNIIIGDVSKVCNTLGKYDFIYAGDVIEHLEKNVAIDTLNILKTKTKTLVVSIPLGADWKQGHLAENDFEVHKSIWSQDDFKTWNGNKKILLNRGNKGKPIGLFINKT